MKGWPLEGDVFQSLVAKGLAVALLFQLFSLAGVEDASAVDIYPGCAPPRQFQGSGDEFHVDPQRGDMRNDGSKERPWRTLQEVLDPRNGLLVTRRSGNPSLPERAVPMERQRKIKPGDTIYLYSGLHGSIIVQGAFNEKFVSVVAAPGQKPILNWLKVSDASHWLFSGLTMRPADDHSKPNGPLVVIGGTEASGQTDNIVFAHGDVATTDDSDGWSGADWVEKPATYGAVVNGSCVAISDSHLHNLLNGMLVGGNRQLIQGNFIDRFGNDGIDITAGDIVIRGNIIRDGQSPNLDRFHPDAIQGWTVGGVTNRNVIIDSNAIIKTGDRRVSAMQGISIFDGDWEDIRVTNNLVVTNLWHGIALFGVRKALIANNTVLSSDKAPTWIRIQEGKNQQPSADVVIKNNIATQLYVKAKNAEVSGNIVETRLDLRDEGVKGEYNGTDPAIRRAFVKFDLNSGMIDLRLRRDSAQIQAGASVSKFWSGINRK